MHPSKRKGDASEREVAALIHGLLGFPARRALGAGRKDDVGDIHGIPDTVIQVANYARIADALRHKPHDAEQQRLNARATFAATFLRLRGGLFRVVLTPEQWATLVREALAEPPAEVAP